MSDSSSTPDPSPRKLDMCAPIPEMQSSGLGGLQNEVHLAFERQKVQILNQMGLFEAQMITTIGLHAEDMLQTVKGQASQQPGQQISGQMTGYTQDPQSRNPISVSETSPFAEGYRSAGRPSFTSLSLSSEDEEAPPDTRERISTNASPTFSVFSKHSYTRKMQRHADSMHAFNSMTGPGNNVLQEFNTMVKKKLGLKKYATTASIESSTRTSEPYRYLPARISSPIKCFLEHFIVSKVVTFLILTNAIIMAMEADSSIKRSIDAYETAKNKKVAYVEEAPPLWFAEIDWFFAVVFTIELIFRIVVYELSFFSGEDSTWNWLDTCVVIFAWVEIFGSDGSEESDGGGKSGMPPLRLFRLIRVIRSVRVIRTLRFFVELRLVLLSLVHSLKPLLWCTITVALIIFMFTNVFLQLLVVSLSLHDPEKEVGLDDDDNWAVGLTKLFPSFNAAMISLFGVVSGGIEWSPVYDQWALASSYAGIVFLLYVILVVLGVLNVISAVFVEGALSKAKQDHHLALAGEQETRKEMAEELIRIFNIIDVDGSEQITRREWVDFLGTEPGRQFLLLFDVDLQQARKLFDVLDFDDDEGVNTAEFVTGFMQINGSVHKFDIELSAQRSKKMMRKINDHMDSIEQVCTRTWARMGIIENYLIQRYGPCQSVTVGQSVSMVKSLSASSHETDKSWGLTDTSIGLTSSSHSPSKNKAGQERTSNFAALMTKGTFEL